MSYRLVNLTEAEKDKLLHQIADALAQDRCWNLKETHSFFSEVVDHVWYQETVEWESIRWWANFNNGKTDIQFAVKHIFLIDFEFWIFWDGNYTFFTVKGAEQWKLVADRILGVIRDHPKLQTENPKDSLF